MRKSKARRNIHLWRDPKYNTSIQGVPLCSCCHKRPRMLTHAIYPHLCKVCYDTRIFKKEEERAASMLQDGDALQRQWLAMSRLEQEVVLRKLRGSNTRKAALARIAIQNMEATPKPVQNLNRQLDPRIAALFNKQGK